MTKPKLVICRGLPASGKTTWAREQVGAGLWCYNGGMLGAEHGGCAIEDGVCPNHGRRRIVRVNRDDIRMMLHNGKFIKGVTEEVVIAVRDATIRAALRKGWNVISDDTNLPSRTVRDLLKIANREGAEVEFKDFTDVPLETCILRDYHRVSGGKSVGEDVIRDQYNRFIRGKLKCAPGCDYSVTSYHAKRGGKVLCTTTLPIPELKEEVKFDPLPRGDRLAVIFDLDGTLAHNNGHRGWYEYEKVGNDAPVTSIVETADAFRNMGYHLIFLSGREESCRTTTASWLARHVVGERRRMLHEQIEVSPSLLMRKKGDHRDDAVVKYEIYRDWIAPQFDVRMVFDDRDRVVRMWRQIGLTCAQVNYGDF